MSEQATTVCPDCQAALLTFGMPATQEIRCAGCRATFVLGTAGQPIRTSRKAVISLALGLSSLTCTLLSGIPAIVLGILALREMRRQPGLLLGRGFALAGIISGAVLGLAAGLMMLGAAGISVWVSSSFERTTEPGGVQEIAASIADFDLPPDMKPRSAMRIIGMTAVEFIHDGEGGAKQRKIFLAHYRKWMMLDRKQVRAQLVYYEAQLGGTKTESTRKWTCRVGGQEVEVRQQLRSTQDGERYQNYAAVLPARDGHVLALVVVKEPSADGEQLLLTTDEVRQFFESFKKPQPGG